ncbi:polysaccharide export protein [Cupriavidus metallidurans]|jgi:polysaccharide biosynthesis/export protein|uniref:Polysaccharide export protein n=2 Tax=Burkholderiaceae TaxID=119060 RepID=A0A482J2Q8_9BURK|nr:capsular biosynthesis protein [Cupriavidus sp. SHE]QBP14253.1 polysaccharide export protein [Cupriavidus metallidurans]QWC92516.1 polysaccharide export protein [Cupriavidus metallidurans]
MLVCVASLLAAGCTWNLPTSGPSTSSVAEGTYGGNGEPVQVAVVDINATVAQRLRRKDDDSQFARALASDASMTNRIGRGDMIDVAIWEAPPAMLFINASTALGGTSSVMAPTRANELPTQMVDASGNIVVPYAGNVAAAGRTTEEVQRDIVSRLRGKANQPQVMVRLSGNASAQVTVVGEVKGSTRMPLTPKGERLLDALAAAGGPAQPVNKTTLQLSRGGRSYAMPLNAVIQDPKQNVSLRAGDVLTVLFQPLSFMALGASGKSDEINFEAGGITLAQALGRANGLLDNRADATGVFIFRFEDPALWGAHADAATSAEERKVPVVYRANLKDPATFFAAQRFPMQDKDVLYVSNAPTAELQKFLNIVLSGAYPILNIVNMTR